MGGIMESLTGGPVGLGLSGAAAIFGAIKGAKVAREQQEIIDRKQAENKSEYDLTANRSFLETAAAKDAVKAQKETLIDNQKQVAGRSAITGASDEAKVAANSAVQKNYSNAISRLAAAGTQYQDNQKRMYLGRKDSLDNQQMALNAQKAESASNLVANAADLVGTSVMTSGLAGNQSELSSPMHKINPISANKVQVNSGGDRPFFDPNKGLEVNKLLNRQS